MAREVIIRMSDDLDRSLPADEAVVFTIDDVTYTIDLTAEHAEQFRELLKPYREAAHEAVKHTKTGKTLPVPGRNRYTSPKGETTEQRDAIRRWATDNGYPNIQARGLVSDAIRQAYSIATGIQVGLNVRADLRDDEVKMTQLALAAAPAKTPDERFADAVAEKAEERRQADRNGVTSEMREWARERGLLDRGGYIRKKHRDQYEAQRHATSNGAQS